MSGMSLVNRFLKESYRCVDCEKAFSSQEVKDTWKCPDCGAHIWVYGEDVASGVQRVLIRKRGDEVQTGDLVLLRGGLTGDAYQVLGVHGKGDDVKLGLKGHGTYPVRPDEPVNCVMGGRWKD